MNLKSQIACVTLAILSITGCASRKAILKDTFMIEARPSGLSAQSQSQAVLAIHPFSIAPAFQHVGLASRVGENQYKSDFYNEYFVSPAQMITNETRNWLYASGLFAQVLPLFSSVMPSHFIEGHISGMYLDARDSDNPQAFLEITFFLIEQQKKKEAVRFQKTYRSVQAMKSTAARDYAAAQSAGLREILEKLEKDLASNL